MDIIIDGCPVHTSEVMMPGERHNPAVWDGAVQWEGMD